MLISTTIDIHHLAKLGVCGRRPLNSKARLAVALGAIEGAKDIAGAGVVCPEAH